MFYEPTHAKKYNWKLLGKTACWTIANRIKWCHKILCIMQDLFNPLELSVAFLNPLKTSDNLFLGV